MEHLLSFEKLVNYDAGASGITLDTTLKLSSKSVAFPAKIDTGSALCVFERGYGEIRNNYFKTGENFNKCL